ncbi:MAG TPA: helix-turn-helix domain-containing protein [Thermomicrobiaceae bacterium]|nr:helix-turn-helix domain-containing protein [Thermomicrobiaceae bacterium]
MASGRHAGSEPEQEVPEAMTIHQLAERSGVPERRIRHFVAQRIIPGPFGRGRAAHYGPRHLEALARVQALRDMNLSLEEIRERIGAVPGPAGPVPEAGLAWHRWTIAPGVELQARDDLDAASARLVRVLLGVARQLQAGGTGDTREDG